MGTAFAITAGAGTETALLLGLPIATLTLILKNIYLGILIPIMNQNADKYAADGNYKGVERMHLIAGFGLSLMLGLVVMISFMVGSKNRWKILLDMIPWKFYPARIICRNRLDPSTWVCDACSTVDQ